MTLNALIAAAAALQRLDGVAGILLFKGDNIVHRQMPFSGERVLTLQATVRQMVDGYASVQRQMRQIVLEFVGGTLLLLIEEESVLALFLTARADPDLVASTGSAVLRDHRQVLADLSTAASAAPAEGAVEEMVVTSVSRARQLTQQAVAAPANWELLRKQIESILSRVMGGAQVSRLIDRSLIECQIGDPYRLSAAQARELAIAVINHVPNTAKRRQLLADLERQLAAMNL